MTFQRYVALGDSFTEGVGDNDASRPNGLRGWADRVAEQLTLIDDQFTYANLAIRGRKLPAIIDEQLEPALALAPDLVSIHGGGNDVLRPKVDLDDLAARYDATIGTLTATGAKVVMFTIFDPGSRGLYGAVRGRMAIFNEWVREIATTHNATVVDMWRMRSVDLPSHMDTDRMHLNSAGHEYMAIEVLDALGIPHDLTRPTPEPTATRGRKAQLRDDARWAKEFLAPWIHRRVTGRSSGDNVSPKRPTLAPIR